MAARLYRVGDLVCGVPPKLDYWWPAQVADISHAPSSRQEELIHELGKDDVLLRYLGAPAFEFSICEQEGVETILSEDELQYLFVPATGKNRKHAMRAIDEMRLLLQHRQARQEPRTHRALNTIPPRGQHAPGTARVPIDLTDPETWPMDMHDRALLPPPSPATAAECVKTSVISAHKALLAAARDARSVVQDAAWAKLVSSRAIHRAGQLRDRLQAGITCSEGGGAVAAAGTGEAGPRVTAPDGGTSAGVVGAGHAPSAAGAVEGAGSGRGGGAGSAHGKRSETAAGTARRAGAPPLAPSAPKTAGTAAAAGTAEPPAKRRRVDKRSSAVAAGADQAAAATGSGRRSPSGMGDRLQLVTAGCRTTSRATSPLPGPAEATKAVAAPAAAQVPALAVEVASLEAGDEDDVADSDDDVIITKLVTVASRVSGQASEAGEDDGDRNGEAGEGDGAQQDEEMVDEDALASALPRKAHAAGVRGAAAMEGVDPSTAAVAGAALPGSAPSSCGAAPRSPPAALPAAAGAPPGGAGGLDGPSIFLKTEDQPGALGVTATTVPSSGAAKALTPAEAAEEAPAVPPAVASVAAVAVARATEPGVEPGAPAAVAPAPAGAQVPAGEGDARSSEVALVAGAGSDVSVDASTVRDAVEPAPEADSDSAANKLGPGPHASSQARTVGGSLLRKRWLTPPLPLRQAPPGEVVGSAPATGSDEGAKAEAVSGSAVGADDGGKVQAAGGPAAAEGTASAGTAAGVGTAPTATAIPDAAATSGQPPPAAVAGAPPAAPGGAEGARVSDGTEPTLTAEPAPAVAASDTAAATGACDAAAPAAAATTANTATAATGACPHWLAVPGLLASLTSYCGGELPAAAALPAGAVRFLRQLARDPVTIASQASTARTDVARRAALLRARELCFSCSHLAKRGALGSRCVKTLEVAGSWEPPVKDDAVGEPPLNQQQQKQQQQQQKKEREKETAGRVAGDSGCREAEEAQGVAGGKPGDAGPRAPAADGPARPISSAGGVKAVTAPKPVPIMKPVTLDDELDLLALEYPLRPIIDMSARRNGSGGGAGAVGNSGAGAGASQPTRPGSAGASSAATGGRLATAGSGGGLHLSSLVGFKSITANRKPVGAAPPTTATSAPTARLPPALKPVGSGSGLGAGAGAGARPSHPPHPPQPAAQPAGNRLVLWFGKGVPMPTESTMEKVVETVVKDLTQRPTIQMEYAPNRRCASIIFPQEGDAQRLEAMLRFNGCALLKVPSMQNIQVMTTQPDTDLQPPWPKVAPIEKQFPRRPEPTTQGPGPLGARLAALGPEERSSRDVAGTVPTAKLPPRPAPPPVPSHRAANIERPGHQTLPPPPPLPGPPSGSRPHASAIPPAYSRAQPAGTAGSGMFRAPAPLPSYVQAYAAADVRHGVDVPLAPWLAGGLYSPSRAEEQLLPQLYSPTRADAEEEQRQREQQNQPQQPHNMPVDPRARGQTQPWQEAQAERQTQPQQWPRSGAAPPSFADSDCVDNAAGEGAAANGSLPPHPGYQQQRHSRQQSQDGAAGPSSGSQCHSDNPRREGERRPDVGREGRGEGRGEGGGGGDGGGQRGPHQERQPRRVRRRSRSRSRSASREREARRERAARKKTSDPARNSGSRGYSDGGGGANKNGRGTDSGREHRRGSRSRSRSRSRSPGADRRNRADGVPRGESRLEPDNRHRDRDPERDRHRNPGRSREPQPPPRPRLPLPLPHRDRDRDKDRDYDRDRLRDRDRDQPQSSLRDRDPDQDRDRDRDRDRNRVGDSLVDTRSGDVLRRIGPARSADGQAGRPVNPRHSPPPPSRPRSPPGVPAGGSRGLDGAGSARDPGGTSAGGPLPAREQHSGSSAQGESAAAAGQPPPARPVPAADSTSSGHGGSATSAGFLPAGSLLQMASGDTLQFVAPPGEQYVLVPMPVRMLQRGVLSSEAMMVAAGMSAGPGLPGAAAAPGAVPVMMAMGGPQPLLSSARASSEEGDVASVGNGAAGVPAPQSGIYFLPFMATAPMAAVPAALDAAVAPAALEAAAAPVALEAAAAPVALEAAAAPVALEATAALVALEAAAAPVALEATAPVAAANEIQPSGSVVEAQAGGTGGGMAAVAEAPAHGAELAGTYHHAQHLTQQPYTVDVVSKDTAAAAAVAVAPVAGGYDGSVEEAPAGGFEADAGAATGVTAALLEELVGRLAPEQKEALENALLQFAPQAVDSQ